MPEPRQDALRQVPSIDSLLQDPELAECAKNVPRTVLLWALRAAASEVRERLAAGKTGCGAGMNVREAVLTVAKKNLDSALGPHYCKAINATGIILHTGLGRAVLPERALRRIQSELTGYSVLQLSTETGTRSRRDERIAWLLQQLTGAESATVVNNNAAATLLVLHALAKGREVVVSRGQLVEIGGSFRLPDVMAQSGAKLVEVGTTNKTHARDYENAINENTAAILRVHPSNYRIQGFTAEVPLEGLEQIAHQRGLLLIDDLGAGALIDFSRFGFEREPLLAESVRAGADVITCSGDKLIGSSQAGLILGKAALLEKIRKDPLARMVRAGKLTLSVLEATLECFLEEGTAMREVPTLRMLARPLADLDRQAGQMAQAIQQRAPGASAAVIDGFSQMGSGSLPGQDLPTRLVAISHPSIKPEELSRRLRGSKPPVFARIQQDQLLIDPRTLLGGEDTIAIEAIIHALAQSA